VILLMACTAHKYDYHQKTCGKSAHDLLKLIFLAQHPLVLLYLMRLLKRAIRRRHLHLCTV
jgi:hypothetical protein